MALFDHHSTLAIAFGILGNLVSIGVYIAPVPTFRRIIREKSTMGFQSVPYVVALFSAMLWMYYALLKTAILLITVNSVGCIIETIYICLFIRHAPKETRKQTIKLVSMLNLGAFCGVFLLTRFALNENGLRITVVGWICVAFSVCVFAAPLSIVFEVVRSGSAEFMPVILSLALTLSAIMWFGYGILQWDLCVAVPNTVGLVLGCVQLVLCWIYRKPKPIIVKELEVEVEVPALHDHHVINIVRLENSDPVHPIGSCQLSSNDDDKDDNPISPHNNNTIGIAAYDGDDDERPSSSVRPQLNIVHIGCSPLLVACPA